MLLAYFAYTTAIASAAGVRSVSLAGLFAINAAVWLGFLLLLARAPYDAEWRDWLPYPFSLLCYREAGWLASVIHPRDLERKWIVWDRLVLDAWHGRAAIESLGPVIPTVLEAAYLSVYIIGPIAVGALYLLRRREAADALWTAFLLGLDAVVCAVPLLAFRTSAHGVRGLGPAVLSDAAQETQPVSGGELWNPQQRVSQRARLGSGRRGAHAAPPPGGPAVARRCAARNRDS